MQQSAYASDDVRMLLACACAGAKYNQQMPRGRREESTTESEAGAAAQ